MYHPIPRDWLFATNKIEVVFRNYSDQKSTHGSGFWIRNDDDLFFATNRHVIDIEYKDKKYQNHDYKLSSVNILTLDENSSRSGMQQVVQATILMHEDPGVDIVLLKGLHVRNPHGIVVQPANLEVIADSYFLQNELEWGTQVSFSSFQPWRDTQTERPILRTGILASDPAHPFFSDKIPRTSIHLLEAFSFGGSSGSPVFANARGIQTGGGLSGGNFRPAKIIGIMAGHILNEYSESGAPDKIHTGLSYCHRSDLLLSMVVGSEPICQIIFNGVN